MLSLKACCSFSFSSLDASFQLFGKHGELDSLDVVYLTVAIEEELEDTFDVSITLADERAMSQESSPFLTAGSLAAYVSVLLAEARSV